MAEVVGTVASVLTLASLFKLCIEAFDIVRTAQSQSLDLKKLTLKLNIEKCRLYVWGQSTGIVSSADLANERTLDICPYPELVLETLEVILHLFKDSQKLRDKYGCADIEGPAATSLAKPPPKSNVLQHLNASFDNFKTQNRAEVHAEQASFVRKTYWVIRDREKFELLIHEAKALIDGLQDITKDVRSRQSQHEMVSSRISSINDVRTLDWLSEVCEIDYPAFSDAASLKADTVSDCSDFHRGIQDWKDTIASEDDEDGSDASSVETTIAHLEDMTVTELKHKFSSYLLRAKEKRLERTGSQRKEDSPRVHRAEDPTTFPKLPWEREIIRLDTRRWGYLLDNETKKDPPIIEAELRVSENILSSMAKAVDKDFLDEMNAVMDWFRVLSEAEQSTLFYRLGDQLSDDIDRTRFFALIQNYRLSKHLS